MHPASYYYAAQQEQGARRSAAASPRSIAVMRSWVVICAMPRGIALRRGGGCWWDDAPPSCCSRSRGANLSHPLAVRQAQQNSIEPAKGEKQKVRTGANEG